MDNDYGYDEYIRSVQKENKELRNIIESAQKNEQFLFAQIQKLQKEKDDLQVELQSLEFNLQLTEEKFFSV